jgi:tRNA (guanine-N7-)-methyltransferase
MQQPRRIRSFVLRAGRTTVAQERALEELWPRFGVPVPGRIELDVLFGRRAPRVLEIGFGVGEVIGSLAEQHPDVDYLGIEVHKAGVGRLLLRAAESGLKNLRIVNADAVDVLTESLPESCLDEILIFFPDPWHKKRHHKRRLIDASFAALAATRLREGGVLRLATDWQDYALQMLSVLNAEGALQSLSATGDFVPRPDFRPATRFERRGERLGHGVWDLAYVKRRTMAP